MLVTALGAFVWSQPSTWLSAMWQAVKEGLRSFWMGLVGLLRDWADSIFASFWSAIGSENAWGAPDSTLEVYLGYAEYWVPVSWGLSLVGIYVAFLTVFLVAKFVKSWIPFVSG